jgi:cytochrome c-type biogenesis protein CcsB
MDKLIRGLFSMRNMALGLLIFLVAIARATFIESDYGTPASKIAIYNTMWFELLLLYLSLCLIVNIFRYRMFRKEKVAVLSFHLAFLVIIFGAGLTRYIGFEGQMRIKEGQTTNVIFSGDPYLSIKANDGVNQFEYEAQHWLSEGRENPFEIDFQLPNQPKLEVEYVSYIENMRDTVLINDSLDGKALEFVIAGQNNYLFAGSEKEIGGLNFSFEKENAVPGVKIWEENSVLYIQSIQPFESVDMSKLTREDRMKNKLDSSQVNTIPADTAVRFNSGRLYMIGNESLMFREYRKNIAETRIKLKKQKEGTSFLTVRLKSGEAEKLVEIPANTDWILEGNFFQFAGLNFEFGYGSKPIELPFSVKCRDFQLDKYPGSTLPSSFASEVTIIDKENNVNKDQRIFMNNVMDYQGYRFFQSSYYPDESGTILSVNYDWWGTNVTYLGYLLMAIGMVLSLIVPIGRFRELNRSISKSRHNRAKMTKIVMLLIGFGMSQTIHAQEDSTNVNHTHQHEEHDHDHDQASDHNHENETESPKFKEEEVDFSYITKEQSEEIADLLVQDYEGRIIPFHTLSDKVLRKVYRDDQYEGINPVQVMMAFHLYGPRYWKNKDIVYVSSKIRDQLGTKKHTSIQNMEDENGVFKWKDDYEKAHGKPDSKKNEYDKKLIKLGERYRIMKEIFAFQHFRVVPIPGDPNGTWIWPFAQELKEKDRTGNDLATNFLRTVYAVTQGESKFSEAQQYLTPLKTLQWETVEEYRKLRPLEDFPTKSKINAEITYNEFKIFDKIQSIYFILGFVLLILFFARTLYTPKVSTEKWFSRITLPFTALIIVVFVAHGFGLGLRWYISGHAPWSNGYEAIIFIAWSTVLAGLLFLKKNPVVLAATALLAAMMLFVTELNLLDPEITPLQPVLKSYWLMIHVAIITSSYGFLGISAILGLLNLVLYYAKTNRNKKRLQMNINEITAVSEMAMIIGLFMLTIGTFLGGIWANESWGRYWGWDPKETWALVSVLTYAIILHLRFIPGLSSKFVFNVVSFWGYSAILFTFFGVNFKLVGLHSYAQGEGVAETPSWVIWTIILFGVFTIGSIVKYLVEKYQKA